MQTDALSMAESFDKVRTERVRLALEADVLRQTEDASGRARYAVTLMRTGNTLHGWRFPAEVLRAAIPHFEGASCFVDHVGWLEQAASLGDLVGVISEVEWSETEGGLTGRLRLSNTPAGDWMEALIDQIIEDRENRLPVPNVGLSADMLAGYFLDGQTRVATEIRSVYSVDAVFYPASGGSFDRVLNSMAMSRNVEGGGKVEEKVKERVEEAGHGCGGVKSPISSTSPSTCPSIAASRSDLVASAAKSRTASRA